MAKWLIGAGLLLLLLGVLMHYVPGLLSWFGRLPGDIRLESERSRTFIPITSMIILSMVLGSVESVPALTGCRGGLP